MISLHTIKMIKASLACLLWSSLPLASLSQARPFPDHKTEDVYYVGINPVAPFTNIRSEVTSQYLPFIGTLETGISAFIGKIWNTNYNVETRLSFGSPNSSYNLLQVHSGLNYLFNSKSKLNAYAGIFFKLYSLHGMDTEKDYVSAIGYICFGNRFKLKRYFLDIRLNQNVYALSWSNVPDTKAFSGFHSSIYKWRSGYIPYAGINIGYVFK